METRQVVILEKQQGTWLSWLGYPIRYTAMSADTGGRYAFSTGQVPVGMGPKPHRHSFEEAFFVIRGDLIFTAGNRTLHVPANGCISIGASTTHSFKNVGRVDAEIAVLVAPAGFDSFQAEVGARLQRPDEPISISPAEFLARMTSLAPRYGIDLNPPLSAFHEPPNIKVVMPSDGRTLAVAGDVYRLLATGENTNGKYALWEAVVPPGGGQRALVHTREEKGFYVVEGDITFHIHGERVAAQAGTFVNLPAGTSHSYQNESNQPAKMIMMVAPAGLEQMYLEVGLPLADGAKVAPPPSPEDIEKLFAVAPSYGIESPGH